MPRTLGVVLVGLLAGACSRTPSPAASAPLGAFPEPPSVLAPAVHGTYRAGLDTLALALARLDTAAAQPASAPAWGATVRARFEAARLAYKRVEPWMEQLAPTTASELNGAAVDEAEEDDGVPTPVPPDGFQVVEALLYPAPSLADTAHLRNQVTVMRSLVVRAQVYARANPLTDVGLFDAVRSAVARVSVLGLANADSPVAEAGLREAAWTLEGIRDATRSLAGPARARAPRLWAQWSTLLDSTAHELHVAAGAAESLDRLAFTRTRLIPLGRAWWALRDGLGVPLPAERRLWSVAAATLFERAAFDPWAFAPAWALPAQPDTAAVLGAALFADASLSADGTRSCVSCHLPAAAFTDGRPRASSRDGVTLRNTPTLHNAALQRVQFADARVVFLEDQVADVVGNVHEMGGNLAARAQQLSTDRAMRRRFVAAFGERGDSTITAARLQQAIAAYLRTLVDLDTPYDRYLRGDTNALSPVARRGYSVFMGAGKCGTCHFAPLFNGTLPPAYLRSELEVLGTPDRPGWRGVRRSADRGRAAVVPFPIHESAFRTPTVRYSAATAPYMHNGVYRTLDEVIEFYVRGGGQGLGLPVPNQTLPPDRLHLTRADRVALVAFLQSLGGSPPRGVRAATR